MNFRRRVVAIGLLVVAGLAFNSAPVVAASESSIWSSSATPQGATAKGRSNGVKDLAGDAMAADYSWSFTNAGTPAPSACPCTLWNGTAAVGPMDSDTSAVELGVRFQSEISGYIVGVRFYKHAGNGGVHIGNLWTNAGTRLATATFTGETPSGWQQVTFTTPVAIAANTTYVASYHTDSGHYAASGHYFASGFDNAPLHALRDGVDGPSGVYRYGVASGFPNETYASANYWVDVVFATSVSSHPPLTVTVVSPAAGATGVSPTTVVTAGISGYVSYPSVNTTTFVLRDPAGNLVPASVSGGGETQIFPLTPTTPLANDTTYTATVKGGLAGVKDVDGTPMAADYSWSFTTGGSPSTPPPVACPCTIWNGASTTAAGPDPDTNAVELGMRFRSDVNGFITGLRFYKFSTNTGTHVGNLWSNTGVLLASATFSGESSSGWQQVNFASPVAIAANTTYVASYHTNSGHYAVNTGYFAAPFDNPPLHALRDGVDGPNGVYRYVPTSAFPMDTYLSGNYWVDVVFTTSAGSGTGDVTPPAIISTSPGAGASNVDISSSISATFSEPMDPPTINSGTVELRDPSGAPVSATVVYNVTNAVAILRPASPLASGTTYTATVVGGAARFTVKDLAGNAPATSYSWSFATAGVAPPAATPCPCSLWSASTTPAAADSDASAVEVGVRFQSDTAGYITGLRFFKMPGNDGIHLGSLWTNGGGLLARATFVNESATGWQQVNFASPVAISANTTYVASYHTDTGHYAVDSDYFASPYDNSPLHALRDGAGGSNGVYGYSTTAAFPSQTYQSANYWVDVVFNTVLPVDTTPPSVYAVTPAAGSAGVSVTSVITATFTEMMSASSISTTTFELRDPSGNVVPASVWAGGETPTATLNPMSPLAYGTTYTATVKGGANGVKDVAGNPMAADFSWSLTTATAPGDDLLETARVNVVDETSSDAATAIVASAQKRGVLIAAGRRRLLEWPEGQNRSSVQSPARNGSTVSSTMGANGLQATMPTGFLAETRRRTSMMPNGNAVAFSTETIKGIEGAIGTIAARSYQATHSS